LYFSESDFGKQLSNMENLIERALLEGEVFIQAVYKAIKRSPDNAASDSKEQNQNNGNNEHLFFNRFNLPPQALYALPVSGSQVASYKS
jgi:hypothetical protein